MNVNSTFLTLTVIAVLFAVLVGIGVHSRRRKVYIIGLLGIIAAVALKGSLRLVKGNYSITWLGVWLGTIVALVIYVAYQLALMRRGVGLAEIERCLTVSRKAYVMIAVALPLSLSIAIGGALAPLIAIQRRTELTTSKLYGAIAISLILVVVGTYLTYYILYKIKDICTT